VAIKTVKGMYNFLEFDLFLFEFVDFSSSTADDFIKECNIAKKFEHPNVLSLIGVCIIPEEGVPLMVMPYMHHGDVKSFIKSKRGDNVNIEKFPKVIKYELLSFCSYN